MASFLRGRQGADAGQQQGGDLGRRRRPRPHEDLALARIYGLIDGNSVYCSCEFAFAPGLRGLPVVVLSNNDGCAIARTAEAKALGIKIGGPWHFARGRRELREVSCPPLTLVASTRKGIAVTRSFGHAVTDW